MWALSSKYTTCAHRKRMKIMQGAARTVVVCLVSCIPSRYNGKTINKEG